MAMLNVNMTVLLVLQKTPFKSLKYSHFVRSSSSMCITESEPEDKPDKKLLKVALVGRPNSGKSTLINTILNMNICGVSRKTHTTRDIFKVSFTKKDTQIVFLDTPGLVTAKEFSRFQLRKNFLRGLSTETVNEVDIIGIVQEVRQSTNIIKFPLALIQRINSLEGSKPLFLVLNKIDLIKDKDKLMAAVVSLENSKRQGTSKFLQKFSRIFFTSAIQNLGVRDIVDYLLQKAKPKAWLFEPDEPHETPLNALVLEHLRASFLDAFPHNIPYDCKYEIEYLKENDTGDIICVGLVKCKSAKHTALITSKGTLLKKIISQLEYDLFKLLGKVFKIRVVVQAPEEKRTKRVKLSTTKQYASKKQK